MPHGNIESVPAPIDGDLLARMVAAAHGELALTAAVNGITIAERDKELVDLAVVAGVVGALTVMRQDDEADADSTRH